MREQESDEPAHHARRPMNAFLIFCKRHRSVVRDKYPNLENRSITKILGEWWANLDKEDKASYTGLAKQYKDAFFNANPDFKWYKLPAPPLRTVSSRPRENQDAACDENDIIYERTNNNSTKVDFNNKHNTEEFEHEYRPLSMFTPGKLADEANMGGLSSLLAAKTEAKNSSNNIHSQFKFNDVKSRIDYGKIKRPKEESIRELQNALSETTRLFEDYDGSKEKKYTLTKNDQLTHQDLINEIFEKRLSKDEEFGYQRHSSDDEKNAKSGRSCKGKRYQEFMAVGGLIVNKRQKRDYNDRSPDEGYGASSWEPTSSRTGEIYEETKQNSSFNDTQLNDTFDAEPKSDPDTTETDNNINKFKASDFDLDAKIKALPSLSLEKFQQRKRENKRRKRNMAARPKMYEPPRSTSRSDEMREATESWSDVVVGSQKRKPRKISITRLEVNGLVSNTERMEHKNSPEIMLAHEAPCTVVHSMELCKQPAHENTDLFALATLAEVAAHTSKIENVAAVILSNLSAKTRDDASKYLKTVSHAGVTV